MLCSCGLSTHATPKQQDSTPPIPFPWLLQGLKAHCQPVTVLLGRRGCAACTCTTACGAAQLALCPSPTSRAFATCPSCTWAC